MEKNPENLERPLADLDLDDVIGVMETYDDRYGFRSSLRSVLDQRLLGIADGESDPELEDANKILGLLDLKQGILPLLDRTGLDLVSISEGNSSRALLVLRDGEKFTDYLRALEADQMTESQIRGAETALSLILQGLQSTLDRGTSDEIEKMRKNVVAHFSGIIHECDRLGESIDYFAGIEQYFARYAEASDFDCLQIYRKAENLGLTEPYDEKKFTLRWHTDANPEYLRGKWDEVVDVIQKLSEDENVGYLYRQALATAETGLEAAISDVEKTLQENRPEKDERDFDRERQFLDILKKAEARLSEYSVD